MPPLHPPGSGNPPVDLYRLGIPLLLETDVYGAKVQLLPTLTMEMIFFFSLNLSLAGC